MLYALSRWEPRITESWSFHVQQQTITEARLSSFLCFISRLKDDTPLTCDVECSVTSTSTSTTLTLSNVGPDKSGSYSCQAQNEAGTSSRTTTVKVVHDPPKVTSLSVTSKSTSKTTTFAAGEATFLVLEGSDDAVLECAAEGWPEPTVALVRNGEHLMNT